MYQEKISDICVYFVSLGQLDLRDLVSVLSGIHCMLTALLVNKLWECVRGGNVDAEAWRAEITGALMAIFGVDE